MALQGRLLRRYVAVAKASAQKDSGRFAMEHKRVHGVVDGTNSALSLVVVL
jgi:hypothetical protein